MKTFFIPFLLTATFSISTGQGFDCAAFKMVMADAGNDFLTHRGEAQGKGRKGDKFAYNLKFIDNLQTSLETRPEDGLLAKLTELIIMVEGGETSEASEKKFNDLIKSIEGCTDGTYISKPIRAGRHVVVLHKEDESVRYKKHPSIVFFRSTMRAPYAIRIVITGVEK